MSAKGMQKLPRLDINVDQVLLKADNNPESMTMSSSSTGLSYAYDKGRLLLIKSDGFIMMPVDNWRAVAEELRNVIDEVERWTRS